MMIHPVVSHRDTDHPPPMQWSQQGFSRAQKSTARSQSATTMQTKGVQYLSGQGSEGAALSGTESGMLASAFSLPLRLGRWMRASAAARCPPGTVPMSCGHGSHITACRCLWCLSPRDPWHRAHVLWAWESEHSMSVSLVPLPSRPLAPCPCPVGMGVTSQHVGVLGASPLATPGTMPMSCGHVRQITACWCPLMPTKLRCRTSGC